MLANWWAGIPAFLLRAVGHLESVGEVYAANLLHRFPAMLNLVAEGFLGCDLDRMILLQLQRLQPRRHRLKVGALSLLALRARELFSEDSGTGRANPARYGPPSYPSRQHH